MLETATTGELIDELLSRTQAAAIVFDFETQSGNGHDMRVTFTGGPAAAHGLFQFGASQTLLYMNGAIDFE